jgi:UDP-N-acetylglucosamine 3-dehydrogenase
MVAAGSRRSELRRPHLYAWLVRLRGTVLGLGTVGLHHVRILESSPRVELAGAVEINGADAGLDPARIYRSVDQLLSSTSVHFAVVALPTALHAQASVALAAAGIHVLVEKPLALSSDEARSIITACSEADVHGAVAHVERYNPALVALKRLLLEGRIGKPLAIVSERAGPFPARVRDGGVISDLATHDLDLIPWLVDDRIELVFAQSSGIGESGREHLAAITGRLECGVVFNTVADWLSAAKTRRVRVVGEEGTLLADLLGPSLSQLGAAALDVPVMPVEPLAAQFDSFCDLLEGSPAPSVVSLEEGLRAVASADAAERSAREGCPVTL